MQQLSCVRILISAYITAYYSSPPLQHHETLVFNESTSDGENHLNITLHCRWEYSGGRRNCLQFVNIVEPNKYVEFWRETII